MLYILPRRLRDKFWPEQLPSPGTFDGQTVLVTGASSGLGLAASQHFARLGARLIITSRTLAQGEATKMQIEQNVGHVLDGIYVMQLDMSQYASCVDFVHEIKKSDYGYNGLDCAILNAGIINSTFQVSPEGWEQTLQINTLSTVLLGLLLLPWMRQARGIGKPPPHLVFVASRDHLDPDITMWSEYSTKGGILRHFSDRENWSTEQSDPNYANSKLMLMYAIRNMSKQAVTPDGTVDVIVNSVCPGLVSTNIARSIVKSSALMRVLVPLYLVALGKSADYGARFYVTASLTCKDQHGEYIQSLFSDEEYKRLAIPNLESDTARIIESVVWKEVLQELESRVAGLEVPLEVQTPSL